MKTWKPWIFNVATIVVMGLFLAAQGVGAWPGVGQTEPQVEPLAPLAASQTVISYQGTLTDKSGNPLNQTVTMEFALYDAATGGNRLWGPETQSVAVSDGQFHVLLGSVAAIDLNALVGDLYLNIKVNGEDLSPRELLTSVVYAIEAGTLPDGAATRGKLTVNGDIVLRTPYDGIRGLELARTDEDNREHKWKIWHMNEGYGKNELEIWEYKTDSNGQDCGGDPADGAVCSRRLTIQEGGNLNMNGHSVTNCGALTEANLQTEKELAAERIDRFEEGDVLCWAGERLEKCRTAGDPLVQAVADAEGRPIVIGAELVKVVGPVKKGDFLVASDVPGYAMAARSPAFGTVIAQALEDFGGEKGIIKAMIRKF